MAERSMTSRMTEVGGWFPFLGLLMVAGGASALDQSGMMAMPETVQPALDLYRSLRDAILQSTIGTTIENPMLADLAVAGVGASSMAMRRFVGYITSIGGFVLLAAVAWFALRTFA